MTKKEPSKPQPILIRMTFPGKMVSKSDPFDGGQTMRHIIERAFGECLGRCEWTREMEFIATLEQFGLFTALMIEKRMVERLQVIQVRMFREEPYIAPTRFDTRTNKMRAIHVDKELIGPVSGEDES